VIPVRVTGAPGTGFQFAGEHCEAGSVIELPEGLARELVSAGRAQYVDDPGPAGPLTSDAMLDRMQDASHRDPRRRKRDG